MGEQLTPFEREALKMLLAGDHPMLDLLRRQADACAVASREFTGVGFFTKLDVPPELTVAPVHRERVVLNDVHVRWDGLVHGASVILFVDHGRLALLEGFTYADPWPLEMPNWELHAGAVARSGGAETNEQQLDAAWGDRP